MITWTEAAHEALEKHLANITPELVARGLVPADVAARLRRRIDDELAATGLSVAGRVEVEKVLQRLQSDGPQDPVSPKKGWSGVWQWVGWSALAVFGVLLPGVTLGLELATDMCRNEFFDPLPSPWHVMAVSLVGLANLLGLVVAMRRSVGAEAARWVGVLNGIGLGVAAWYSLWFLPMSPIAVLAIIFFGLGLLPLSPALSLVVGLILRAKLHRRASEAGRPMVRTWPWMLAGVAAMVALEIPPLIENWAVRAVSDRSADRQETGLWLLHHVGSEDRLLRGCYDQFRNREFNFNPRTWLAGEVSAANYQEAYFRVTGRPFNHRPPPVGRLARFGRDRGDQEWVWDEGLGGENVSQRLKALYLTQSRLDGKVEGDAAAGYLEWTMVFRNDHEVQQREARTLIQLPPGGVVSRLTLWVDGEEREAAFGGRSQVRQAYQAVVSQRRDPVLVTTKGPDRVLVQCFPVPPKGGQMKVRLGITFPLLLGNLSSAQLALPRVLEQNYSAAPGLKHSVWIESPQALTSTLPAYQAETPRTVAHALRGLLEPKQFAAPESTVTVARDPAVTQSWLRHPLEPQHVILQTVARRPAPAGPVAIVIDGSHEMGPVAAELAGVLANLPDNTSVRLWVAGSPVRACPATEPRAAGAWLATVGFEGGQDSTEALAQAADALRAGGSLLWIHGAQPMTWQDSGALEQGLARRRERLQILALAALPGANVVLEKLDSAYGLAVAPRLGSVREDLARTLDRLREGEIAATRRVLPASEAAVTGPEATSHLGRLWAADEVARLLAGGQGNREAAVKLAVRMQLVTAMTGAVVLETKQQYDVAGLEPVNSSTVPTVPEGGSTLAVLVGALALAWFCRRQLNRHSLAMNPAGRDRKPAT
ncbi:MAG TPA: VIT domain-containing protein [Lacunisphaera sp.]|nr:VIT domain-containing protein [Lacunisphaera sp.]